MTATIIDSNKSSVIDASSSLEPVIVQANGGSDYVIGSPFADVIDGGPGADTLIGGAGDDTFTVSGSDQGSDTFRGDDGFDRVLEGSGDDVISLKRFAGLETVELIDGSGGLNVLAGTSGGNVLDFTMTTLLNISRIEAGAGNDIVIGSAGDDTIDGGLGADKLSGGAGNDTFLVWGLLQGIDTFNGGDGFDRVLGSAGDDIIALKTFSGSDTVELIDGGGGFDIISGTSASDLLDFSSTELLNISRIEAGAGSDTVIGSTGDDTFAGGTGNDRVDGKAGFDAVLFAGLLADYRISFEGAEVVVIDLNTLDGDEGTDRFQNVERLVFADGEVPLAGPNTAPVAANDLVQAIEDTPVTVLPADLLANDSDPDGDFLTFAGVSNPVDGSVSIDGNGNIVFAPAADFNGIASFDYTISDTRGGSATGMASVAVASVNDAPVAAGDRAATNVETAVAVQISKLLANDRDPDGDPLTVLDVKNAANGTVIFNGNGEAVFTPAAGFVGTASFEYTVGDGNGATDTGLVTVAVGLPPSVPAFQVLVTNNSGHNVLCWDGLTGEYLGEFIPRTTLRNPTALTIGPDGDLYVAWSGNSDQPCSIYRYDATTGQNLGLYADLSLESDATPDRLTALTFGPDGDLYVFDNGGRPHEHKIFRFDGPDSATPGVMIEEWSTTVDWAIPAKRIQSYDMEFGSDGNLYISNRSLHEILVLDGPSATDPGALQDIFASAFIYDTKFGPFHGPAYNGWSFEGGVQPTVTGLAWGPDGNLYATSGMLEKTIETGRIAVFDPDGNYLHDFVPLSFGLGKELRDIDFGPDGNLYLTNLDARDILVFGDPTGPQAGELIQTLSVPANLAFRGAASVTFSIIDSVSMAAADLSVTDG